MTFIGQVMEDREAVDSLISKSLFSPNFSELKQGTVVCVWGAGSLSLTRKDDGLCFSTYKGR